MKTFILMVEWNFAEGVARTVLLDYIVIDVLTN